MQIVALEEHFVTEPMLEAWETLPPDDRADALQHMSADIRRRLLDLGDERIAAMDASGVDRQILSVTTPGTQTMVDDGAVAVAARSNDLLADAVRARPDRFGGFATLPTPAPQTAAAELRRAVVELELDGAILYGRTDERHLDDPAFAEMFAVANELRAPLYLHPQPTARPVRAAYYAGLGDQVDALFAGPGIGWHYETGIQLLRLVLAGTLDRFPDVQIVTGHWGEVVLFYLERSKVLERAATRLKRPILDYFRSNISITPSGLLSQRYLRWAIEMLGVERVLFSADYPYVPAAPGAARTFLADSGLSAGEQALIAHGNWDRLTAAIRR